MKTCSNCQQTFGLDQFYKHPKNKDGLFGQCIECIKIKNLARYKKNPSKQNQRIYKNTYGVKHHQKQALLIKQNGCCAICEKPLEEGRKTHQDHCHKTGILRGVLCNNCNVGLGHFKDSVKNLLSALRYIKRYSQE